MVQIFPLGVSSHKKAEHAPTSSEASCPVFSSVCEGQCHHIHANESDTQERGPGWKCGLGTHQHIQVGQEIVTHTPMKAGHPSTPTLHKHSRLTPEIYKQGCVGFFPPQGA